MYKEFHKHDDTGHYYQLLTPRKMKEAVLKQMHNSIVSGHLGNKKTKEKINEILLVRNARRHSHLDQ